MHEQQIVELRNVDSDGNLARKMVYTLGDVTYEPHVSLPYTRIPPMHSFKKGTPTLQKAPLTLPAEGSSHTHEKQLRFVDYESRIYDVCTYVIGESRDAWYKF